ncbi:S-adenosyl-L-methionine-dependent methyltransferase [Dactylonectria estremocensis]|uniref:S-adenosyl-L-methionine-dependent methyltransferase n=1 Tax=Dactylonectria estremocensis TaxID=1079267 RepID=A0A9P9D109_9HYPO|nr:S-adenosyl-L-methionine-dependent methyltransferase [Dactylonectria estremocensis]
MVLNAVPILLPPSPQVLAASIALESRPFRPLLAGPECPIDLNKPFDYIHSRMMTMSVGNWKEYIQKGFDNLVPGGYMEFQEVEVQMRSDDSTLTENHPLSKWCTRLDEACNILGRPWVVFADVKEIMAEVGFTDIVDSQFKWPINRWPKDKKFKELGAWTNENVKDGAEALTLGPFTRAHGWEKEQVDLFLVDVRKDLDDTKVHAYWPICSIYGKKPEA